MSLKAIIAIGYIIIAASIAYVLITHPEYLKPVCMMHGCYTSPIVINCTP